MAFADNFPLSESVGVFVGVAGFDWLADGNAEILRALAAGILAGIILFAVRRWSQRRRR